MRATVRAVAVVAVGLGLIALAVPQWFIELGRSTLTPGGMFVIAAIRIVLGIVLFMAAPETRAPGAVRAIGGLVIVAGFLTPAFGADRSRLVLDWCELHGPITI